MNESRNLSAEARKIAHKVITEYSRIDGLAFGYGLGSVFAGFSHDSDMDINFVWDQIFVPSSQSRPVYLLCDPGYTPVTYNQEFWAKDHLRIDGRQVEVVHHTQSKFDRWVEMVQSGHGWNEALGSMPLFDVSAFFYGIILVDPNGKAALAHQSLEQFPEALAQKTHENLTQTFPYYRNELAGCVRRGDAWLFHELAVKILRDIYIT